MSADDDIDWRRKGRVGRREPLPKVKARRTARPAQSSTGTAEGGGTARPRRKLSVRQRVQIAKRGPQAVLKVLSYRQGRSQVLRTLAYALKKAEYRYVREGDELVEDRGSLLPMVDEWEADFSERANGRDALHMEVSAPAGSDRDIVFAAARAFIDETFSANHQYALAEHRDTKHPHVHILVKMRGHDGKMLNPRKADLQAWRERFAEKARERGLNLQASSRALRGVGRKGKSQAVYQMKKRGIKPDTERQREQAAARDWATGNTAPNAFEAAALKRNAEERAGFMADAARLQRHAGLVDAGEGEGLHQMARDLKVHAETLPAPVSERQAIMAQLEVDRRKSLDRGASERSLASGGIDRELE